MGRFGLEASGCEPEWKTMDKIQAEPPNIDVDIV
jgi:hypothetical protein